MPVNGTRAAASSLPRRAGGFARSASRTLSVANIGAVYVLVVAIIVFSIWEPGTFPRYETFASVLNDNAVTALLALSLVVPLAAGVFDLSIGFTLGASNLLLATLLGNGWGAWPAMAVVALVALGIGIVNAVVVVLFQIDSFIGTLATGSLLQGLILALSNNQTITAGVDKVGFLASTNLNTVTLPVFVALAVAVLLWYLMEHTATGRFLYATGLGREQARLAAIRVRGLQFGSLLVSALLAGIAGILVTAIVGAGSPTIGPPYLIPAFAAAFLGATQVRDGMFNAAGTIVAVLLLGTVNTGLALANVPLWTPYVFNGGVLIVALGLRGLQSRRLARHELDRRARARQAAVDPARHQSGPARPVLRARAR